MAFVLNSSDFDKRDRAEFVREAIGMTLVPVELQWPESQPGVLAKGVISDLGDLTICDGRTSAVRVDRTPSLARDDMPPSVFIHVQTAGTGGVVQEGREAVLRPGGLVMYDCTAPYTLLDTAGVSGGFFRIPHAALALPPELMRQACAVPLSPGHPLTALTYVYLRRLVADPALPHAPSADLVAHPSIELIRAVITTHLGGPRLAAEPLDRTLEFRVLEYARRHLHDPELSADQIAAAHYVSVRHLYKVLARSGIGLSDWIRRQRLEGCRQGLAQASTGTTIAAVARQWGFVNMSSFSRAFRAQYGLSPREWRERHESSSASS